MSRDGGHSWAGGDGGPCPICGEDMAEKVYEETLADGTVVSCEGRYWHMKNEHGIMEDYVEPSSSSVVWLESPVEEGNSLMAVAADDLLVAICRCPIMEAHLEGRGGDEGCGDIVLHQWAQVPSEESRRGRWHREHHVPVPWVGHLESAPILFISSNPNLSARDIRKAEKVKILEPEPLPELREKRVEDHPSLRKPFRAAKWYWEPDEMIDLHEDNFEVWVKDDGVTPLSGSSGRRPKVPYWEFAHDQSQHLICGRPVRPGHDYALTEVVHCKSAAEHGVKSALEPCVDRYLGAVVGHSPARVVVVVGEKAAQAVSRTFHQPPQSPPALVGPVPIAGLERFLLYTRHPGWLRRNPSEAEANVLPMGVTTAQLEQLRAAVA